MAAVTITKAPTIKATNLTVPSRTNGAFSASWRIPSNATTESRDDRWTNVIILWTVTYDEKVDGNYKTAKTLLKKSTSTTDDTLTLIMANQYPNGPKVRSVSIRIRGWNSKGYGPDVDATLTMAVPDKPTVALSYNSSNGKVTATVTATNPGGAKHRYDDVVWVKRQGVGGTSMLTNASVGTGTSRTFTHDLSNATSLTAGQVIAVTASAKNRGMRGDGDMATKKLYVCHPNRPICGAPSLSFATRGVYSTASVVVPIIDTGVVKLSDGTKVYPTTVKLQRLKDSAATTAEDAATANGWADVDGATDGGTSEGLLDAYADAVSAAGLRTWYRVAAIRDGFTQYGVPKFAACLYEAAPTVTAGVATISSLSSNAAGDAASVAWAHTGGTSGGGVEFSWSTTSSAWSDTTGPSTYELTTNSTSGTRTISSLTSGTTYYVRVRGFAVQADGTKKYGKYSDTASVTVQASTGTVAITSITPTSDRAGAKLVMSKQQTSDAIEISWSKRFSAWWSNDAPSTTVTTTGGTTKTWYVYGLEPDTTYYFRLRAVDGTTYGAYTNTTSFTIEGRADAVGTAAVTGATTGTDGQTVKVTATRSDASQGLQLSWSTDEQAWDGTDKPKTYDVEDFNGKTATVYVKGLAEGVLHHFRARCYSEASGGRVYGAWSTPKSCAPYGEPGAVSATFPEVIPLGKSWGVSWAHESSSPQRAWRVYVDGKIVANGNGTRGAVTVSRQRALAAGTHSGYVSITTGTGWANSPTASFVVASAPTGTLSASATLTAQPISLSLTGSGTTLSAQVTVTAHGCAEDELHDEQPSGLVVWSGMVDGIAWTTSNNVNSATVTLPGGLDLRDGASYTVSVALVDDSTGLSAALAPVDVSVAWSHQAAAPTATVTPQTAFGVVSVAVTAPSGAAQTDVCDLWRMTPDGGYLIAQGRAFGTAIVDAFAPFCESRGDWTPFYRVVTRTVDGDMDFVDVPYNLFSDHMRIDWGEGRGVELEYALSMADAWAKGFEAVTHLDGTIGGTWSSGVKRTSKLSGVLVRTASSADQAALRELAKHVGPAFVRLNNGSAFMAHVQVTNLAWSAKTYQLSASLSATELTLGAQYMAEPVEQE